MHLYHLILAIGATGRLTRLTTTDVITQPLRRRVHRLVLYNRSERATLAPQQWAPVTSGSRTLPRHWVYALLTCDWCVAVWIATAIVTVDSVCGNSPAVLVPEAVLATAFFAGWLTTNSTSARHVQPQEGTAAMTTEKTAIASPWVIAYAELATLYALERANARLLHQLPRSARHHSNGLRTADRATWHTKIATDDIDVDQLLDGALARLDNAEQVLGAETAVCLRDTIGTYLKILLAAGLPFSRDDLARVLASRQQCLPSSTAA
ncbi:hypothetical protein BC739_006640 [Kutzneria viridogrisea]|uniref:DUF1360 domain-containing protein n=2 Tax=Kutzneria viridogrisea TaxID=47990 RepID=A0ABR6BS31_9PSEU|nr:hypothetical protein [Kutzneria viridogrisea]